MLSSTFGAHIEIITEEQHAAYYCSHAIFSFCEIFLQEDVDRNAFLPLCFVGHSIAHMITKHLTTNLKLL